MEGNDETMSLPEYPEWAADWGYGCGDYGWGSGLGCGGYGDGFYGGGYGEEEGR